MRCYITFGSLFLFVVAGAPVAATSDRAAIRDLHAKVLTPSSDALFAAESNAPTTDSKWGALRKHADALVNAAKTLSALPQAKSEKQWRKLAADLREGADAAAKRRSRTTWKGLPTRTAR